MKILIKKITISLLLIGFHSLSVAASNEIQMEQGQTRTVNLKMVGALTASSVSVSGQGVSARIMRKSFGTVRVRLTTAEGTPAGLKSIRVRLAAGTNRTPLYVYGIEHAPYTTTGPNKTGYFQKVEITMPVIHGKIFVQSDSRTCVGSNTGNVDASVNNMGAYTVKKTGNKRIFWVTSSDNSTRNTACVLSVRQESTIGKKLSQPRNITVSFNKDTSVPAGKLNAPRLKTANGATEYTNNRTGNSPKLNWSRNRKANYFIVRYTTYGDGSNVSNWRRKEIARHGVISNLSVGSYQWCVIAGHRTKAKSILSVPESDCSAVRKFNVTQRN